MLLESFTNRFTQEIYPKVSAMITAITPGQAAVFYWEDLVIGDGIIEKTVYKDVFNTIWFYLKDVVVELIELCLR